MRAKLRQLALNIALLSVSVLATFAFFELVVFGMILKPDDVLPNVSINGVVRYQPSTRATFRHPDGTQSLVTTNAQGWNSTKPSYVRAKTPGVLRVAVVGDSYVHGSFVNPDQGFPEVIERELNAAGVRAEVLRFGMDGAPLSQYLHMLRREVRQYQPDVVVVQLIHNDFDETYRFLKTRYASSFLKIGVSEAGRPVEIAPVDFKAGGSDLLRNSNTFRYLYYKTGAYLQLKNLVSRLWWGGDEEFKPEFISSAVDIRKIADHAKNRFFARYVLCRDEGAGARRTASSSLRHGWRARGRLLRQAARELRGAQAQRHRAGPDGRARPAVPRPAGRPLPQTIGATASRFEFAFDWHWNALGNALAGEAIAKELLSDRRLLGARPAASTSAALPAGKS